MTDPLGCCHRCASEHCEADPAPFDVFNLRMNRMFLCPTCGNKRCPRATDHRHACTGSNEPGQPGSRYERMQP